MTLSESFPSPRLPKTVKRTPAPAAKPNLSFSGNNCSIAKTRQTLISNTLTYFKFSPQSAQDQKATVRLPAVLLQVRSISLPGQNRRVKMSGNPAVTMGAKVQKIIKSPDPRIPEKAEIDINGCDELYREIRIENTLTDADGTQVELKQGAHVEVTVEAEAKDTTLKTSQDSHLAPTDKP
jgi:hypothetical protein